MIKRIQLPFKYDSNYRSEIVSAFENNEISMNDWNAVKRVKTIQADILYHIMETIEESIK